MPSIKKGKMLHEAPLIQCFKKVVCSDARFGIEVELNFGSDNTSCSDVEYISKSGEYLIVEAKTHESRDAYNTRHKIFGQLLKEHGKSSQARKENSEKIVLSVLIPKDKTTSGKSNTKVSGYDFYRNGYSDIPEALFSEFGKLVKAEYFFVCSVAHESVDVYNWSGFQKGEPPIYTIATGA